MAVFNEILVGRFNRYLQKLTSIKASPPSPALGTEIAGQFDLNSVMMEDRVLLSINSYWTNFTAGAVAAQNSAVRLRNPKGSKIIAIVEFIGMTESVADQAAPYQLISIGQNNNDLPTSSAVPPLDTRSQGASSNCVISSGNNVIQAGLAILSVPATVNSFFGLTLYEAMQIPLLPGTILQVQTTAVNTLLTVDMKWRERALEDSEQNA